MNTPDPLSRDIRPSHPAARFVIRHWLWILIGWFSFALLAKCCAPSWTEIAYDGDFDYLPKNEPSLVGGRLLDEAFPEERSRSEIILVMSRSDGPLTKSDAFVALDLQRRISFYLGKSRLEKALQLGWTGGLPKEETYLAMVVQGAKQALDDSIAADEKFYEKFKEFVPDSAPTLVEPRVAIAYWERARLQSLLENAEQSALDREAAMALVPDIDKVLDKSNQTKWAAWQPLLDVLSSDDSVIGHRLVRKSAKLVVVRLESDLSETSNIATLKAIKEMIANVQAYSGVHTNDPEGLSILPTGSAAIGAEILAAANDAIRYTEAFTVLMILVILSVVYRAPLLVFIPILSIGVAVLSATGIVTSLAQWSLDTEGQWLDLRIFTTSKIFVVVILFGAGTDYCLFLIARLREEATRMPWREACETALTRVTTALLGSALTTIVGLGMLWIADYGKFHYTGPVIALCLLVGLAVCTTLTPALLYAIGPAVLWPNRILSGQTTEVGFWGRVGFVMTKRPHLTLASGIFVLLIPAVYGYRLERSVTYDLSSQLNPMASSRLGLKQLSKHFSIGDTNPATLILVREDPVDQDTMAKHIETLVTGLYELPGVKGVRTAEDPLGDFRPNDTFGVLKKTDWNRLILQQHRVAQRYFFSDTEKYAGRLARIDVVVDGNPFGIQSADTVSRVRQWVSQQVTQPDSGWGDSQVAMTGTTASIIDLRRVTLHDNRKIKVAVVVAVCLVLLVILRRFWLSIYLIVTVLLSYYATLGLTICFFRLAYGDSYVGLDWKLPLYLFVILVAVGQDYNVYLVTRILEEQKHRGWLSALRRAVSRTGGIITSCGLVMAGTFFSMTASAWFPGLASLFGFHSVSGGASLRGVVELGFALGLGVLIDTFYIRTILVPAFIVVFERFRARFGT